MSTTPCRVKKASKVIFSWQLCSPCGQHQPSNHSPSEKLFIFLVESSLLLPQSVWPACGDGLVGPRTDPNQKGRCGTVQVCSRCEHIVGREESKSTQWWCRGATSRCRRVSNTWKLKFAARTRNIPPSEQVLGSARFAVRVASLALLRRCQGEPLGVQPTQASPSWTNLVFPPLGQSCPDQVGQTQSHLGQSYSGQANLGMVGPDPILVRPFQVRCGGAPKVQRRVSTEENHNALC